jgi:RND superfamily putative drug exporter
MNTMKATLDEMRDNIADFDDEVRPIRNYFYWDKLFQHPGLFRGARGIRCLDGVNSFSDNMAALQKSMDAMVAAWTRPSAG